MDKVRVGMVGYKFMGKAHSNAYRALPMFFPNSIKPEMTAICGRDPEGLEQARAQFGWESSETDWKELVKAR
jgi:predicted dehydrogenase